MAPIHLINVTINETTSKSSRVVQRDRKGKSMTVAPSGYLYPPHSPSRPLAMVRCEDAENLPLSSWMAISGAAFTTGPATTPARNGDAGQPHQHAAGLLVALHEAPALGLRSPSHLVQSYLLRELRAYYEGTEADRWYLSDGGITRTPGSTSSSVAGSPSSLRATTGRTQVTSLRISSA